MILLFFSVLLATTNAAAGSNLITIYADVYKDVEFFTKTYPWIVDNIGGELFVTYHLVGSGRYSVPHMCALQQLYGNTFLQAQYLKCEAEGKPSEYCLCETGINAEMYKACTTNGGLFSHIANMHYLELGLDITPIIGLEPQTSNPSGVVFGVDDITYLKAICSSFTSYLPRGCIKPFASDQSETFPDRKVVAQIDRVCHKEFPVSCDDDKPPVTEAPVTNPPAVTETPVTDTDMPYTDW